MTTSRRSFFGLLAAIGAALPFAARSSAAVSDPIQRGAVKVMLPLDAAAYDVMPISNAGKYPLTIIGAWRDGDLEIAPGETLFINPNGLRGFIRREDMTIREFGERYGTMPREMRDALDEQNEHNRAMRKQLAANAQKPPA
jgi:hypothetical protein